MTWGPYIIRRQRPVDSRFHCLVSGVCDFSKDLLIVGKEQGKHWRRYVQRRSKDNPHVSNCHFVDIGVVHDDDQKLRQCPQ